MLKALFSGACAAIILAALCAAIVFVRLDSMRSCKERVAKLVPTALWSVVYIAIELFLCAFAATGKIVGDSCIFVLSAICVCFGGVSSIASKVCLPYSQSLFFEHRHMTNEVTPPSSGLHAAAPTVSKRGRVFRCAYTQAIKWLISLLSIAGASLLCFLFLEMPSNASFLSLEGIFLTSELAAIAGVVAGMWFIGQRRPVGLILPMIVTLFYGIAEYFVELFKKSAITPSDLRSIATGMSVAGGYEYEITTELLFLIGVFGFVAGLLTWLRDPLACFLMDKENVGYRVGSGSSSSGAVASRQSVGFVAKNIAAGFVSLLIGIALVVLPLNAAMSVNWRSEGLGYNGWAMDEAVDSNGLIPSFMAALQLESLETPEGYDSEKAGMLEKGLSELYDRYVGSTAERQAAVAQFDEIHPNVIVIMNESFADLSFFDGLGVGYSGPEYLTSMDAIAKGLTSVSVHGGGTCNSEFEALTGTSLGYAGIGSYPFAIYDLSNIETLPKRFRSFGYETIGIHPAVATNWSRDKVYPKIGLDVFIDVDGFSNAEQVRGFVRDSATYDMILDKLIENDEPQFIFDLTIMGHGGYGTGLISEEDNVALDLAGVMDEGLSAATNEYLSLIRMSDNDIGELLAELKQLDEPTVVAFFGDHQPGISADLWRIFTDGSEDIGNVELLRQTDYFIWSNYDVDGRSWPIDHEGEVADDQSERFEALTDSTREGGSVLYEGGMSPADLVAWTMDFIGAPLSDYEKAGYISRYWIPSINSTGYMDIGEEWHFLADAYGAEGSDTFAEGMRIIEEAMEQGLPADGVASPLEESRQHQDAVMVNVMRWITYLNFAGKV